MEIQLIYPLKKLVTTKWYYLCFMSLNVFCMLLSVLPLTLRHQGTCLPLAAGCRQYAKPENGKNAAVSCHAQQLVLTVLMADLCLFIVHVEDQGSSFAHKPYCAFLEGQWFQNDKFITVRSTRFRLYIWSKSESRHYFSLQHVKAEIQVALDAPLL